MLLGNKNRSVTCETRYSGDLVLKQDSDGFRVDFPLGVTVRQVGCVCCSGWWWRWWSGFPLHARTAKDSNPQAAYSCCCRGGGGSDDDDSYDDDEVTEIVTLMQLIMMNK